MKELKPAETIHFPSEMHQRLRSMEAMSGRSLNSLVLSIIDRFFKERDNETRKGEPQ